MGGRTGASTTRAATTRRALAAALVLGAIPLGAALGLTDAPAVAAWGLAAVAGASALLLLVGGPIRGRAGAAWRAAGVGMAVWAFGLATVAAVHGDAPAEVPLPDGSDVLRLGGLALMAAALATMAFHRVRQADWIGRLDAAAVGVAAGAVATILVWPLVAETDATSDASFVIVVSALAGALVVGCSARLAFTRATQLPAGRFAIEGAVTLAGGSVLLRAAQLTATELDLSPRRHRAGGGRCPHPGGRRRAPLRRSHRRA